MIIYLISAELFVIKAICLWCSSVHVATLLLFIIIATPRPSCSPPTTARPDPPPADGDEP